MELWVVLIDELVPSYHVSDKALRVRGESEVAAQSGKELSRVLAQMVAVLPVEDLGQTFLR